MKKTLLKVLSSTIALTLVATAALATAPVKKIPAAEVKAPVRAEEVREEKAETVLEAVEQKVIEEKAAEVKAVKAPAVQALKAEPEKAEAVAPVAEAKAETAAPSEEKEAAVPAQQAEAPEVPEVPEVPEEKEAEPEMIWDVSETEFDNVAMAFYAEPAEGNEVEIDEANGVVYIRGTGNMETDIYRYFLSTEKYLEVTKRIFEEYYGVEVERVYDETVTDVTILDATIEYYSKETGERLYVNSEMLEKVSLNDFAQYHPKTIVVEEGITNVSDYAFVFCSSVETVVLPSTVEVIGLCAFEHCSGLKNIIIPEDAFIQRCAFAYCNSLANVQLVNADYYTLNGGIAKQADNGENNNENARAMSEQEIYALVHYWG